MRDVFRSIIPLALLCAACDSEPEDSAARDRAELTAQLALELQLTQLDGEATELWPLHPDRLPQLRSWLQRADEFGKHSEHVEGISNRIRARALDYEDRDRRHDMETHPRRPELLAKRQRIWLADHGGAALPPAEAAELREQVRALEGIVSERRTFRFADPRDEWLHARHAGMLEKMRTFVGTRVPEVRRRVGMIEKLQKEAAGDGAAWQKAAKDGLAIPPQFGLVPIGKDPASKRWEFAHRFSGAVPKRDGAGKLIKTEDMAIVLVLLPAGTAKIGAVKPTEKKPAGPHVDPQAEAPEAPIHEVQLDRFLISKFEVTQAQWRHMTGETPSEYGPTVAYPGVQHTLLHPVERVSWHDCTAVLRQFGLVIPTEVQWEYAARAGTDTIWSTSSKKTDLEGFVNLADQTAAKFDASWAGVNDWPELNDGHCVHSPVGHHGANGFGLHDVHGNLWEWCRDRKGSYRLPARAGDGFREVAGDGPMAVRGGSYNMAAVSARSANRGSDPSELRSNMVGIRPAMVIAR